MVKMALVLLMMLVQCRVINVNLLNLKYLAFLSIS